MVDVVVPVYRDVEVTEACLRRVLETSGALLGQLVVVNDASPEPGMSDRLAGLAREFPAVVVLENERNLGFVRSANRGLGLRRGDVVLLNSDTLPAPGWLEELNAVARTADTVGAVVPLSNNATLCAVPGFCEEARPEEVPWEELLLFAAEPRVTEMPTGVGFCLYLSGRALDLLGPLDVAYGRGYHEENDWCARARRAGLRVLRANRAYVAHLGAVSFGGERERLDRENERRLVARYPDYLDANHRFAESPEAHVAALRAHRMLAGGPCVAVFGGALLPPLDAWAAAGLRRVEPGAPGVRPHVLHVDGPVEDRPTLVRLLRARAHLVLSGHGLLEAVRRGVGAWALTELLAGAAQAVVACTEAEAQELRARFPLAAPRVRRVPGWAPAWQGAGAVSPVFAAHVPDGSEGLLPWLLAGHAVYRASAGAGALPLLLSGEARCRATEPLPGGVRWVEVLPERPVAQVWLRLGTGWPLGALEVLARGVPLICPVSAAAREALADVAARVEGSGAGGLAARLAEAAQAGPQRRDARAHLERLAPVRTAAALALLYDELVTMPFAEPLRAHGHLRELLDAG